MKRPITEKQLAANRADTAKASSPNEPIFDPQPNEIKWDNALSDEPINEPVRAPSAPELVRA
jgi:hypothetical protein